MKISLRFVWSALLMGAIASTGMALDDSNNVVIDYKLDYKTTKKQVSINGWQEFTTPSGEEPVFYLEGKYSGIYRYGELFPVPPDGAYGTGAALAWDWEGDARIVWGADGPTQTATLMEGYGEDSGPVYSLEESIAALKTSSLTAGEPYEIGDPPGDYTVDSRSSANSFYDGFIIYSDEGYVYSTFQFEFQKPDDADAAENRATEIAIAPPPPPEEPQPSSEDLAMVGASFRAKRTGRDYVRYASQFNLKLKLCEGEYTLKWRVEGKDKDDTGSPESFPQQRDITIDENTSLDADGYYDLGWIDIAQELTPNYVYRLSTYKEGATQTFYIEPKDKCGCSALGSSGGVAFGSVKAWFNLGKDSAGKSAGFIQLYSENIESDTHLPSALRAVPGDSTTARFEYDDAGALRQAISDRHIIDIVPLTDPAEGYQLKFYNASDATGWDQGKFRTFDPSATPYAVWTVKRLADSGGFKRLEITRSEGGTDFVNVYSQDLTTSTTWSFSEANGLRITARSESAAPDGDTYRTTTISDGSYGVASVKRERVHTFAWGDEIVEETLDPSGAHPLTTSYEYYTSGVGQGQLWKTTDANGTVTENTYESIAVGPDVTSSRISGTTITYLNGRVQATIQGTLADLTSNTADEVNSLITTTESFGGQVFRRSWQIGYAAEENLDGDGVLYTTSRSIRAAASSAAWDDSRNEVTISRTASPSTGRISVTVSADGTASRTEYGLPDSEGIQTITTESGPVNATGTGLLADSGGTRTAVEIDALGRTVSQTTTDIASSLVTSLELVTDWDTTKEELPTNISYLDGSEEVRTYYPCCGKLNTSTRNGASTSYTYDALGRQKTVTKNGLTTESYYDAEDRVRVTELYPEGSPSSAILVSAAIYDPAGRITDSTRPFGHGQTVSNTYGETINATTGETTAVTTYPSDTGLVAGVVTELRGADGQALKTTGNAASPVSFSYSVVSLTDAATWGYSSTDKFFVTLETKLDEDGDPTSETVTTYQDALGRLIKTVYAGGATARRFYDSAGRLTKDVDPDGVTTLYGYETGAFGERNTVAIDLAATTGGTRNGTIDLAGGYDRVTVTTSSVADRDGTTVRRTETSVWENGTEATEVGVSDVSVDGLRSWQTVRGTQTTSTVTVIGSGNTRTETTTNPNNTKLVRSYSDDRVATEVFKDSVDATVRTITYQYDDYGRLEEANQTGVGPTNYTYFDDGQIETVKTPDPGSGRQTTTYAYNNRGWVKSVTNPDTTVKQTSYYPAGQVKREWGSRTYPVEYTYDAQGRRKTMTTWQDFAGDTRKAITTWNYNPQRGWLDNKRYNDNKGPDYTYTDAGRLETRTWARTVSGSPLVTTYGYTDAGDVESVDYSDTTPDVANTYDRAGRLYTTTDAAGTLTRSYDPASGNLSAEAYSGTGLLAGHSIARTYDTRYRPQSLATDSGYGLGYRYDTAGRLESVSQGSHTAVYGYKDNQGSIETITIKRIGMERLQHTRQTDAIGRTKQVASVTGSTVHMQRDYGYNGANQRDDVTLEDGRHWAYGYDDLGQVTSAQKRLSDNVTPLPGYGFGYTFDDIGNRTETTTNGESVTYARDTTLLNQYDSRIVSGVVDVRGEAHADTTVTVNGVTATRSGKDFYRQVSVDNSSGAVNAAISIEATRAGPPVESATDDRSGFVAKTPEDFDYDDDGNLKQDGRWVYSWDAENRLITMETRTDVATALPALKQKLEFAYDAQGRRINKVVESWNALLNDGAGGWVEAADWIFIYDGWNLLTELDALNADAVIRSHAWGLDLSQTLQGAGGVGGLLWTSTPTHSFAACTDANGNIVAWVNTATSVVSGRADYAAFGEVVQRTGSAGTLPFGFSSKYTDGETGLNYFGYRFYSPKKGRWLSRDPIEEQGGINYYGMNDNELTNRWDYLGLSSFKEFTSYESALNEAKIRLRSLQLSVISDAVKKYFSDKSEFLRYKEKVINEVIPRNLKGQPTGLMQQLGYSQLIKYFGYEFSVVIGEFETKGKSKFWAVNDYTEKSFVKVDYLKAYSEMHLAYYKLDKKLCAKLVAQLHNHPTDSGPSDDDRQTLGDERYLMQPWGEYEKY